MTLLAAVGVGVLILGAIVLLLMPDRPGGTISWAGAQVNSAGAGLPLIVVGVATVAIGVSRGGGDDSTTTSTTTQEAIIFEDSFSTPADRRWSLDSSAGTEAHFSDGALQASLTRGAARAYVEARPRTATSVENVRVSVEAHRLGGTATAGYGYGIFCRSDGAGNLYAFTLWANHAVIEKRTSGGQVEDLGTNADVTAQGDAVKKLEAVCATIDGGRAVDLRLLVNGEQVLQKPDRNEPLKTGAAGLRAVLPKGGGNVGDTLEVEFDNFKISADE